MKMAPIHKELDRHKEKIIHKIVHTGQHYDKKLSDVFFKELELPKPDIYLDVGSKSHSEQTAEVMVKLEKVLIREKPDMVLVYGDVNSTIAAGLVCAKIFKNLNETIPLAHIESGLRSFDKTMPEEINRVLTDFLSKYLFVTEKSGVENLKKSGFSQNNIFFVGNTMIDSLVHYLPKAKKSNILQELCLTKRNYGLITLHRPSNVDNKENFQKIIEIFKYQNKINPELDIVFPVHPRTLKMLNRFELLKELHNINNLVMTEPLGYFDFLNLILNAKYVLTDSGGIQEETTYLKIPCLTLRENTERPITCELGTNTICCLNSRLIFREITNINSGLYKKGSIPKLWDGNAAKRIVKIIMEHL
jgi:UDP-N-acetylglucosamine 2-epimerase (non-hydrolysing)